MSRKDRRLFESRTLGNVKRRQSKMRDAPQFLPSAVHIFCCVEVVHFLYFTEQSITFLLCDDRKSLVALSQDGAVRVKQYVGLQIVGKPGNKLELPWDSPFVKAFVMVRRVADPQKNDRLVFDRTNFGQPIIVHGRVSVDAD